MTDVQTLLDANLDVLRQGLKLLEKLEPAQYNQAYRPAFESTIGAHYRHVLEHYYCFFNQLEGDAISYDSRRRDCELETRWSCAQQALEEICERLETSGLAARESDLLVQDQQLSEPVRSSVARELLFLQAHAVHHFAMIAAMMRALGMQPEADFGVSLATRLYRTSLAKLANQG